MVIQQLDFCCVLPGLTSCWLTTIEAVVDEALLFGGGKGVVGAGSSLQLMQERDNNE